MPASLADGPVNPLMLLAVMARDWATPFGSRKQHLNTLDRTCYQHPPSAWQSLMPKAVTAGYVSESSLRQERVPGCRSARNDESHVITQDVCRRETCQRTCSIHFSCYLHNFDVFRLDGLLNPQVLGLEMFQTSRAMPEQHACGSVQCVNQRISPHLTSHFTKNVHQSQHASQATHRAVQLCFPAAQRDHWLPSAPMLNQMVADL